MLCTDTRKLPTLLPSPVMILQFVTPETFFPEHVEILFRFSTGRLVGNKGTRFRLARPPLPGLVFVDNGLPPKLAGCTKAQT